MSRRCPSCKHEIANDAVLCIECGLDLRSGDHLETEVQEPAGDHPSTVDESVDEVDDSGGLTVEQRIARGRILTAAVIGFFLAGQILYFFLMDSANLLGATGGGGFLSSGWSALTFVQTVSPWILCGFLCYFMFRGGYYSRMLVIILLWVMALSLFYVIFAMTPGLETVGAILLGTGAVGCALTMMYSASVDDFLWYQKEQSRKQLMF